MTAPTVAEMRMHLCSMAHLVGRDGEVDGQMFDQVLREAKAQAWDEGYTAGVGDATGYGGIGEHTNPYREVPHV